MSACEVDDRLFIGGTWVCPHTEEVGACVAEIRETDIDRAVTAARGHARGRVRGNRMFGTTWESGSPGGSGLRCGCRCLRLVEALRDDGEPR